MWDRSSSLHGKTLRLQSDNNSRVPDLIVDFIASEHQRFDRRPLHTAQDLSDRVSKDWIKGNALDVESLETRAVEDVADGAQADRRERSDVHSERGEDWRLLLCGHVHERGVKVRERKEDMVAVPLQHLKGYRGFLHLSLWARWLVISRS